MQNHPKPDSKLILRHKEDFVTFFNRAGPFNQPLIVLCGIAYMGINTVSSGLSMTL